MVVYKQYKCEIVGEAPLLMHNGQLADPLNKFTKELKKICGKRNKTDSDFFEMAKIEFMGSLYVNKDGKAIIPGAVIEAAMVNAGRAVKKGKEMLSAIKCDNDFVLKYSGDKDCEKRFESEEYRYTAGVLIKRSRIMRTRPIFKDWSANIVIEYNPTLINLADVVETIKRAGDNGIMDYRPKFGRFKVVN